MRVHFVACGLAGVLALASCTRHDPPIYGDITPAVLNADEALDLAEGYLDHQQYQWGPLRRHEMRDWGYIFFYQSPYVWDALPPKTSHIVAVHHDGTIREWLREDAEQLNGDVRRQERQNDVQEQRPAQQQE